MKTYFPLARDGYVVNYLVTKPAISDFEAPYTLSDQLEFERQMREIYYKEPVGYPTAPKIGETAPNGETWYYYTDNRNPYVDFSVFYYTLKNVTFPVATTLVSDKKRTVRARVWSYAAFDMWCGGEHIATERVPVYQPIRHTDVTLELSEGENDVFFLVQNFGVRDTRNMISFQLYDTDGIKVTLPVEEQTLSALAAAEEWFASLKVRGGKLILPEKPDFTVEITADGRTEALDCSTLEIDLGKKFGTDVTATVLGHSFKRVFEQNENVAPEKLRRGDADPWHFIASESLRRVNYYGMTSEELYATQNHGGILYTLAHVFESGCKLDERAISDVYTALKIVDSRSDCSDFILSMLLRFVYQAEMPDEVRERIRKSALNFRYWMDENGADAMCFWSENHALTFYCCQYMAGELYPDDVFLRSGRTGREQKKVAARRIREWLDVVEVERFEEFCAGGYLAVTAAALVFVYDFCTPDLAERAAKIIDYIAGEAALQCFRGIHIAPMGRIYRSSMRPYASALQCLLHAFSDENVFFCYAKLVVFGMSRYKFPDVREAMTRDADVVFNSGRAEIHTKKTKDYMLTSVASPRHTEYPSVDDEETEYFKTKVMNESFHGTSLFTPGGNGYQQHLWYAAISDTFYTFVNLPGSERDFCNMRPGYWFGNLIFPALRQEGKELFCHYDIPDRVPTKFTHAYYPAYAADELCEEGGFRFARVDDGYIALWCSEPLELTEGDAVVGADLRAYGDKVAWYVRVGSLSEDGDFAAFRRSCLESNISYDGVVKAIFGE